MGWLSLSATLAHIYQPLATQEPQNSSCDCCRTLRFSDSISGGHLQVLSGMAGCTKCYIRTWSGCSGPALRVGTGTWNRCGHWTRRRTGDCCCWGERSPSYGYIQRYDRTLHPTILMLILSANFSCRYSHPSFCLFSTVDLSISLRHRTNSTKFHGYYEWRIFKDHRDNIGIRCDDNASRLF